LFPYPLGKSDGQALLPRNMEINTEVMKKREAIRQAVEKSAKNRKDIEHRYANEVAILTKEAISYASKRSNPFKAVTEVLKYFRPKWQSKI